MPARAGCTSAHLRVRLLRAHATPARARRGKRGEKEPARETFPVTPATLPSPRLGQAWAEAPAEVPYTVYVYTADTAGSGTVRFAAAAAEPLCAARTCCPLRLVPFALPFLPFLPFPFAFFFACVSVHLPAS